jgi:hypothetical protein
VRLSADHYQKLCRDVVRQRMIIADILIFRISTPIGRLTQTETSGIVPGVAPIQVFADTDRDFGRNRECVGGLLRYSEETSHA